MPDWGGKRGVIAESADGFRRLCDRTMNVEVGILKETEARSTGDPPAADRPTLVLEDLNAPYDTPDPDHDDSRGRGNHPVRIDDASDEDESANDVVSFLNLSDDDWDDDDDEDEEDEDDDDFDSDDEDDETDW